MPADCKPGSLEYENYLQDMGLYFGLADVKDCFHRLKCPYWLSEYFCLRPIPAKWVGMGGHIVSGEKVSHEQEIYPMAGSFPMGFSCLCSLPNVSMS